MDVLGLVLRIRIGERTRFYNAELLSFAILGFIDAVRANRQRLARPQRELRLLVFRRVKNAEGDAGLDPARLVQTSILVAVQRRHVTSVDNRDLVGPGIQSGQQEGDEPVQIQLAY